MTIVLELRPVYCPSCHGMGKEFLPAYILGVPAGHQWFPCTTCDGVGALGVEEVEVLA